MAGPPTYSKLNAAAENVKDINRYSDTQDATLRAALGGVAVTNELSPRTLFYSQAAMLKHAQPILILEKFATPYPMPANKGQSIKMRRPVPFAPATTPLVEGVTPDPQKMSFEDVETSLKQYGAWMGLTDIIQDTHEDPILKTMSMLCGEQAAETKEMLMWGVLTGGTNLFTGTLDLAMLRSIKAALVRNRAKMITKILNPSPNITTSYVEASFVAIGHSDLETDLRNMTDGLTPAEKVFIPTAAYGSRSVIHENEVGSIENFRFILSPYYTPPAGKKQLVILGQDCVGTVPLKGKNSIQNYVLNPGVARSIDPLGQRGSIGWKTWFAALITNQAWMARWEDK